MIQKKPLKSTALIFTLGTLRNLKLTKVQEKKDRITACNGKGDGSLHEENVIGFELQRCFIQR